MKPKKQKKEMLAKIDETIWAMDDLAMHRLSRINDEQFACDRIRVVCTFMSNIIWGAIYGI